MNKLGKIFVYAGILIGTVTMVACGTKFEALKAEKAKSSTKNPKVPGTVSLDDSNIAKREGMVSQVLTFITMNHSEVSSTENIARNELLAKGLKSSTEVSVSSGTVNLRLRVSSQSSSGININYNQTNRTFSTATLVGETLLYRAVTVIGQFDPNETMDLDVKAKCMDNVCNNILFIVKKDEVVDDQDNLDGYKTEITAVAVLFSKTKSGSYAVQNVEHEAFLKP